jgi:hypothetical protein
MGILRPIVFSATEIMPLRQAEITQRSAVRWQFVGDEGIRDEALVFEQLSHQFQCRSLVSPALNQDIQDLAFITYCTPEVHTLAIDQDKHFVQVPTPIRAGTQSPERTGIAQPELQRPAPDGLIGNLLPRSASRSSTSRKLRGNLKYSQTACWMITGGNRYRA